jgi:hypothetical protein
MWRRRRSKLRTQADRDWEKQKRKIARDNHEYGVRSLYTMVLKRKARIVTAIRTGNVIRIRLQIENDNKVHTILLRPKGWSKAAIRRGVQ